MLYEPKKEGGKDVGKVWRLVYGKIQYRDTLPTINMGLFRGHCFLYQQDRCFVSRLGMQRMQANL